MILLVRVGFRLALLAREKVTKYKRDSVQAYGESLQYGLWISFCWKFSRTKNVN